MQLDANTYKTPRTPAITFPSIHMPVEWPKAQSDKCCLFEAINLVGSGMNGVAWTGHELCAMYWLQSPEWAEAQRLRYLSNHRTTKAPPPPRSLASPSYDRPKPPPPSFDAHIIAKNNYDAARLHSQQVDAEQRLWEANLQAHDRLQRAVEWLAQKCRDSKLTAFARLAIGGALFRVGSWEWNVDDPLKSIVSAGGHTRIFSEFDRSRSYPSYLFFDRADLGRVIATLAHVPASIAMADLEKLSPYIRFAVSLAKANGFTAPDKRQSKKMRQNLIRAAWAEAMPGIMMSDTQVDALALVMGWPNQSAIENGLTGPKRRKNTPQSKG